jgi:tripartite-type tricarboxylate transporter receptor subunit TctC
MRFAVAWGWLIAATAAVPVVPASAQEPVAAYPSRNVEFVVPFAAGGSADVIARLVGQAVSDSWKQPVVIQNRAGATGQIASEYVLRAPADGYTLLLATASTHTVLPAFKPNLPYDTLTGFAPVALLATFPNMLVVNPQKVPSRTVAEFIDLLKKNPGKLNYASTGQGGSPHFTAELFKLMTGTNIVHVPYRGGGPALADLVSGTVDATFDNMATVWSMAQEGKVRALGVATAKRTPLAPEIPAIAETVPGFEATSFVSVVAPAGTPAPLVEKISQAFGAAVRRPEIVKRLGDIGASAAPSTPAELASYLREDLERWRRVAREANLTSN